MAARTEDIVMRLLHALAMGLAWFQDRVAWDDSSTVGGWRS